MTKLLPCPFCGSFDLNVIEVDIESMHYHQRVCCNNCTDNYGEQYIAVDTWNKRNTDYEIHEGEGFKIERCGGQVWGTINASNFEKKDQK